MKASTRLLIKVLETNGRLIRVEADPRKEAIKLSETADGRQVKRCNFQTRNALHSLALSYAIIFFWQSTPATSADSQADALFIQYARLGQFGEATFLSRSRVTGNQSTSSSRTDDHPVEVESAAH